MMNITQRMGRNTQRKKSAHNTTSVELNEEKRIMQMDENDVSRS